MEINSVLITGANRGLGLEFVKQFLTLPKPPKYILAVCRVPSKAPELEKLAAENASVHIVAFEITDPKQYDKAVNEVHKIVGTTGLNVLINNAAIFDKTLKTLETLTKENLMEHFDINFVSPVLLIKAFLPLLKQGAEKAKSKGQLGSSVINISAILGCNQLEHAAPGSYPYKYTKAALNLATVCLDKELHPSGIVVIAIHPGHVSTDMGGPTGALTPYESVSGCMKVITGVKEEQRGQLFTWKGELVPYGN